MRGRLRRTGLCGPRAPAQPGLAGRRRAAEGRFEGAGGVSLFEQSWRPAEGTPKAALIVVHGLKDHGSRYAALGEHLAARGIAVHALDLRGHGDSAGDRVWVDAFEEYLADLEIFLARVTKAEPGKPIFLLGHSMGGAIATLFTLTRAPALRGLVLSGAALKPGADISGALIAVTGFLATVTPSLAVMELDDHGFSRDPAVVKAMQEDPVVYQGKGPARTASELLDALEIIQARMEEIAVPLLILHGGADRITDPEGSRQLGARAKSADKTVKVYDGLFHDLLHEPEKAQVVADVTAWIETRVP